MRHLTRYFVTITYVQCFIYKAVIFPNKDMVLSRTFVTEKGLAAGCKAFIFTVF